MSILICFTIATIIYLSYQLGIAWSIFREEARKKKKEEPKSEYVGMDSNHDTYV